MIPIDITDLADILYCWEMWFLTVNDECTIWNQTGWNRHSGFITSRINTMTVYNVFMYLCCLILTLVFYSLYWFITFWHQFSYATSKDWWLLQWDLHLICCTSANLHQVHLGLWSYKREFSCYEHLHHEDSLT